jgi:phosphate-selective porin OprO/OprP
VEFKDGFVLKTPDNQYQLRFGGWVAYDWAWFHQDDEIALLYGDEQDGTGFRTVRLRLGGKATEFVDWQVELDFAGENGQDTPYFLDTYVQFNQLPYLPGHRGELRMGHFKEPFSGEEISSEIANVFVERSLASVFNPSRNAGVQWSDQFLGTESQPRLAYSVGVFKTTDNWPSSNDSDEDQGYALTARLTGLPWLKDEGRKLLHLGVAYSHRNPDGAVLAWNARPESRLALFRYANSDPVAPTPPPALYRLRDARADDVDLYNLEAAFKHGPLLLQGEYTLADVDTTFGGRRHFNGYYAQASYVLTGESRPYRFNLGVFDRVFPKRNVGFGEKGGWGAWEAALRYSHLDLSDGPVRGGEQSSLTAGINWFLNPHTKVTLNYIHSWVEGDFYEGDLDILQTRVHLYF